MKRRPQGFEKFGPKEFAQDIPVRILFSLLSLLPYRQSLNAAAWFSRKILAGPFGINRRIEANLNHVWPDLDPGKKHQIAQEAIENSARLMVESFQPQKFVSHAKVAPMGGPGLDRLLELLNSGEPVVLVSGHFGNYQVLRVLLGDLGFPTAAIYRPMSNGFSNRRYIANMDQIAGPNFARGMAGTKNFLGHLRNRGCVLILNDQALHEGKPLKFLGKTAKTMTSAAEFTLKYHAHLVPFYGIRQQNGVDFDVIVEEPIPHSDPETMTQAINDSLENMVHAHPGQWFWLHRRWRM